MCGMVRNGKDFEASWGLVCYCLLRTGMVRQGKDFVAGRGGVWFCMPGSGEVVRGMLWYGEVWILRHVEVCSGLASQVKPSQCPASSG